MAVANTRINDRLLRTLSPPRQGSDFVYDPQTPGFGVRITANGIVSFVLNYQTKGRKRRFTIGRYPELSATSARQEAIELRGRIRAGNDPLADKELERTAPTVSDLFSDYFERHACLHKRSSSAADDQGMARNIILPKLGKLKVEDVSRRDIEELHKSVRSMPYRANRVLALLSKMMSLAVRWEWRANNPCAGIPRFPEERRERWLSTGELETLLDALNRHPSRSVANAVRLLLLTGARRGEVLSARWEEFDLERGVWTKPSHHTKQKRTEHVPLSAGALQLLVSMKGQTSSELLFPGRMPGEPLKQIKKSWSAICRAANIKDARLHDLRHTYASHLVSAGMSLPIVGRLLGHTQPQTTARYAHFADDPLRQATDRFASIVAAARSGKRGEVIPLKRDA